MRVVLSTVVELVGAALVAAAAAADPAARVLVAGLVLLAAGPLIDRRWRR